MPIVNRVSDLHAEITGWRHDIHAHPELLYDVHRTAGVVAEKLRAFGCDEVVTGLGETGVVGVIHGKTPGHGHFRVIGLRSDMDALPIEEDTGLAYQSTEPGKMHACGHDGHTAMLLGAARYLTETRNFAGTAIVIFQPAEEGGNGAEKMIQDGLIERFKIDQVYGMHNRPGLPLGQFAIRSGPSMAATDRLDIEIEGKGGHAARPHFAVDSLLIGTQLVGQLQSIVSRNIDPLESAVISICEFHAGNAHNVIPQKVTLSGTVRTLKAEIRDQIEKRMHEIVDGVAAMTSARITLKYQRQTPVLVNHDAQVEIAARVAATIVGEQNVRVGVPPVMGGEDFAFMLQERPGAFINVGNGDSAPLHHPAYNFNDEAIVFGTSYWIKLVETTLQA
jgi:amidohydrolase